MDAELTELLERARNHVLSPEELAAQRASWVRAMADPDDADLSAEDLAARRAEAAGLPEHLQWKGDGPMPASWMVGSTKVYRSFADYCDD